MYRSHPFFSIFLSFTLIISILSVKALMASNMGFTSLGGGSERVSFFSLDFDSCSPVGGGGWTQELWAVSGKSGQLGRGVEISTL